MTHTSCLTSGSLSAVFEPDGGLRHIAWGGQELFSRIYVAVRDKQWGTVPAVLSRVSIDSTGEEFSIRFHARNDLSDIRFQWDCTIIGRSDGNLTYSFAGVAEEAFLTNRIGICVLHSSDCAGRRCKVLHVDGNLTEARFPVEISPHQPFQDIAAIEHEFCDERWARIVLFGDVFEMEDQRNWSDASFKTYCTPLSRPFPVRVERGTKVSQSATITVRGTSSSEDVDVPQPVQLSVSGTRELTLPRIGLRFAVGSDFPNEFQAKMLSALGISHLRVDLDCADGACAEALEDCASLARLLNVSIEAALFVSAERIEEDLSLITKFPKTHTSLIGRWLILERGKAVTNTNTFGQIRRHLAVLTPHAAVGGGTDENFAELNRGHLELPKLDLLCFPINPQVHAFDTESLFETLPIQKLMVEAARSFRPGTDVAVSPITLKPRGQSPDPRQREPLASAWTLGCLSSLTEGGASSITLFNTHGPNGVMDDAEVYPVYRLSKSVLEFGAQKAHVVRTSSAARAVGLCLQSGCRWRLIVANMTPHEESVVLNLASPSKEGARESLQARILAPYETVVVDWQTER